MLTEQDFVKVYCRAYGAAPSAIRIIEWYRLTKGGMAMVVRERSGHIQYGCFFVGELQIAWTTIGSGISTTEIGARQIARSVASIIGATKA